MTMTRVHVFCEGKTESTFVRQVLWPHFEGTNISLNDIIVSTSTKGKGGITSYERVKTQVVRKCKEDRSAKVTILWDLYRLPKDFPSSEIKGSPEVKAGIVKQTLSDDIDQSNFIPNVVVHEFEGLLFSNPYAFSRRFGKGQEVDKLIAIRRKFPTPEHIDEGFETAPSRRIQAICKGFHKIDDGTQIALDIGLKTIRQECPLFDSWIREIEKLKGSRGA